MKITRENFTLRKVKRMKGGGIAATYQLNGKVDGEMIIKDMTEKTPVLQHPDLDKPFELLVEMLLKSSRYFDFMAIINSKEFKATAEQKTSWESYMEEVAENVTINGITITGEGENQAVMIMSTLMADNMQVIAVNSPRIKLEEDLYSFEMELQELKDTIEREVYSYLFENKKAQLEMF
jgi:hypothetical protein